MKNKVLRRVQETMRRHHWSKIGEENDQSLIDMQGKSSAERASVRSKRIIEDRKNMIRTLDERQEKDNSK